MSQFENSEVMVKFAELMLKEAVPPGPATRSLMRRSPGTVTTTPGPGTQSLMKSKPEAFDLPEPEIIPSPGAKKDEKSFFESPAGMITTVVATEAAIPVATSIWAKLGLGAGIAVGWPAVAVVGIVAAVAGIGYAIYWNIERADNNVADLIDRIKDLDYEDTDAESTINSWIAALTQLRQAFAAPMTTGDSKERFTQLGNKIVAFEEGMKVLNAIGENYNTYVKSELKDWFGSWGDKGDFEKALQKTITNYSRRLQSMYAEFKKVHAKANNPRKILEEIRVIEKQVAELWAAPLYDKKEQAVIAWAEGGGTEGTPQQIQQYNAMLLNLSGNMKNKILPQAKRRNQRATGGRRRASVERPLSKRAVTLPKEPTAVTPRKPRRPWKKTDTVTTMQEQINDLSTALDVNIGGRLREDGIYGPNTANAVAFLIQAFEKADAEQYPDRANLSKELKRVGISYQEIVNHKLMRSTPRLINRLTNAINNIWQYHVGGGSKRQQQISQRDKQWTCVWCGTANDGTSAKCKSCGAKRIDKGAPGGVAGDVYTGPTRCDWNAPNPTRGQMLECFKTLQEDIGGERTYLYDYARRNLNMSDNAIMNLLDRLFGRVSPSHWSRGRILDALGGRFSLT